MTDITRARARRLVDQRVADGTLIRYGDGRIIEADHSNAPGAIGVKHRLLSALRQALGEPFHVSNSGFGPGPAAWATLIAEGPYYVDITVRPAGQDDMALRRAEWDALTPQQQGRVMDGGIIAGIPLRCEFCDQIAIWSTGDATARVACWDLRHIAMAESIGSVVPPESLLAALRRGLDMDDTEPEGTSA